MIQLILSCVCNIGFFIIWPEIMYTGSRMLTVHNDRETHYFTHMKKRFYFLVGLVSDNEFETLEEATVSETCHLLSLSQAPPNWPSCKIMKVYYFKIHSRETH